MPFKSGKDWNGYRGGTKANPIKKQFAEALAIVEKAQKKSFIQHLCERAYKEDQVAIALAKKILPDKIEDVSENRERFVVIRAQTPKEAKADK